MNQEEAGRCFECEAELPDPTHTPIGNPLLASAPVEKVTWDHSFLGFIQESVELYFRTFFRLVLLLLALCLTGFGYFFASLALVALSPWFLLLVVPVGMVLGCSFWSSHLCLLVDAVRGNRRPIPQLIGVGFLRGIGLTWSLLFLGGAFMAASFVLSAAAGPLGILFLWIALFPAAIWAYPYLPVLVLENRGPIQSFWRAVELTENFRLKIFCVLMLNCLVAFLFQVATVAILALANISMDQYHGSDLRALIPLTLGAVFALFTQVLCWSLTTVMAFVVFWKRTNGDKVALFL